jgi:hypothetical protein
MLSLKWPLTNENTPLVWPETPIKFVDGLKRCRTSNKVTDEEMRVLREKRANDDARKAEEQQQETLAKAKATVEAQSADEEVLFAQVLSCMTDCRFGSLHGYRVEGYIQIACTHSGATRSGISSSLSYALETY